MRIRLAFVLGCTGALTSSGVQPPNPRAAVEGGTIEGLRTGPVAFFKGIPYAAPPVGNLRWRPPKPVVPWRGIRFTRTYGHDCVQQVLPGDVSATGSTQGEDCLVLNVWRPVDARPGARLPVMVWIHGGGFLNGAASVSFYDGSQFARDGIVLVSFNYRLGRMGFFAHPALTAENDRPLANYALLDQLAALKWVHANIAALGGNPENVTIAGESAGGISVIHFLTWPAARGLFQRAIVMSGGGRSYIVEHRRLKESSGALASAEASGVAFAKSIGISGNSPAALKALRAVPAAQVNGDMSMTALVTRPATYAGGPVIEGDVVTAEPEQNVTRGNVAPVPLLIGTTGNDLGVSYPASKVRPLAIFGSQKEDARQLYDPEDTVSSARLASLVAVDITMHEPARFFAKQMTMRGAPVWLYRFDYVADFLRPKVKGATHGSEVSYLFAEPGARYGKSVSPRDRAFAQMFHQYIVNFVRTGDPNGQQLPPWSSFDPAKFELMMFSNDGSAAMEPDPRRQRLALVERAQLTLARTCARTCEP